MERPSTATVRIRGHDNLRENPTPQNDDIDATFDIEPYISADSLRSLTGVDDLHEVTYLELKVDTSENSLGQFGSYVPNLNELKLSNSVISSIRDLGTQLSNLTIVWMARCGLKDLDGMSSLSSVEELYLAFNDIKELRPLTMLDNLQVLDIEGNAISDFAQVEFLALCPKLTTLTLEDNPVCSGQGQSESWSYHQAIFNALPKLKCLDGVDPVESLAMRNSADGTSEASVVRRSIKLRTDDDDQIGARPTTASGRPGTASSRRPGTAGTRPNTAQRRPGSARPRTAVTRTSSITDGESDHEGEDTSSALTLGSDKLFCGSPLKALMARRETAGSSTLANSEAATELSGSEALDLLLAEVGLLDEPESEESEPEESKEDILADLKAWREEYALLTERLADAPMLADTIEEEELPGQPLHVLNQEVSAPESPKTPKRPVRRRNSSSGEAGASPARRLPKPPARTLPTPPKGAPRYRRPHTASGVRSPRKKPVPPISPARRPHSGPVRPPPRTRKTVSSPRSISGQSGLSASMTDSVLNKRVKLGRIRPSTAAVARQDNGTFQ